MKHAPAWISSVPIAHRGLHSKAHPENTRGAFQAAIAAGNAIELDIHVTRDRKLAVIHDGNTTRGTGEDHEITKTDYIALQHLKLFSSSHGILLLDDVIKDVAGRVPLLVEIKTGTAPSIVGPLVMSAFTGYEGEYAVMSFDPRIVLWFKNNAPHIPRGLLSGTMRYHGYSLSTLQRIILRSMISVPFVKPHFLAYDVDDLENPALAFWRRLYRLPVLMWPVLLPVQYQRAKTHHANVIFENVNTDEYRYSDR